MAESLLSLLQAAEYKAGKKRTNLPDAIQSFSTGYQQGSTPNLDQMTKMVEYKQKLSETQNIEQTQQIADQILNQMREKEDIAYRQGGMDQMGENKNPVNSEKGKMYQMFENAELKLSGGKQEITFVGGEGGGLTPYQKELTKQRIYQRQREDVKYMFQTVSKYEAQAKSAEAQAKIFEQGGKIKEMELQLKKAEMARRYAADYLKQVSQMVKSMAGVNITDYDIQQMKNDPNLIQQILGLEPSESPQIVPTVNPAAEKTKKSMQSKQTAGATDSTKLSDEELNIKFKEGDPQAISEARRRGFLK